MANGSNFIEVKGLIDNITKAFLEHKNAVDQNIESLERLEKVYASMPSEFLNNQKKISEIHKKQASSLKNLTHKTAEHIQNEKILRRNVRETGVVMSKLTGAYEKASNKLNVLRRRYQDLAIQNKENTKEAKALLIQITKLDAKLKRVDAAVGKHNRSVGDYAKSWKGAAGMIRTVTGAFGIYSGLQVARAIYKDIKAVDAMNKALQQVTETQEAFNQAKAFLNFVADESGQVIGDLTKAYNKFYASAKTTNLTLEETQNIFRQVSKAAGILGLSSADAEGALRALEQMLSKGKVQAEEIRGQLGERLPGAFQILAKSMGITTKELDKQLKDGKVLADEVLPKFAKELERTYSLDKVDRVKTLVAEQNRLSNAWLGFVETLNNNDGVVTKILTGTLKIITNLAEGLKFVNMSFNDLSEDLRGQQEIKEYNNTMKLSDKITKDVAESMKQQAELRVALSQQYISQLTAERDELKRTGKYMNNWLRYKEINKLIEEQNKKLGANQGILRGVNEILGLNTKETDDNTEALDGNIKKREKLNAVSQINPFGTTMEQARQAREEMTTFFETFADSTDIDLGKLKLDEVSFDEEALKKFEQSHDIIGKGLERLAEFTDFTTDEMVQMWKDSNGKTYEDYLAFTQKMLELDKSFADQRRENAFDLSNSIVDTISSTVDTILELRVNGIEEEQEYWNEYYDSRLNDERLSKEQREKLEAEKRKRDEQLRKKQEKEEKKAFLFKQGLALAQIAIDLARAISGINAMARTLPPLVAEAYIAANVPYAIGISAAQAAAVVATSIPAFADGVENSSYEGPMLWGEVPGKTEVKVGKGGISFADKPTIGYINKGETIYSSINEALNSDENIQKAVWQMNALSGGNDVSGNDVDLALISAFSNMEKSNKKVWKEVKQLASRPINNNITIENETAY